MKKLLHEIKQYFLYLLRPRLSRADCIDILTRLANVRTYEQFKPVEAHTMDMLSTHKLSRNQLLQIERAIQCARLCFQGM